MSNLSIEQAIDELRDLVRCRCHPAFTERKLHDPDCNCDSAEAVEVLANALPAVSFEPEPRPKPFDCQCGAVGPCEAPFCFAPQHIQSER